MIIFRILEFTLSLSMRLQIFFQFLFEYGYEPVDVACAHGKKNVGVEGVDHVGDLFAAAEVFVHSVEFSQDHA